ncbi:MAG: putative lipid II flippase FtsW [Alphaproteobacteria bacterium]|nr:putative lipid II flippase FtsW [Alphaproteobacteria bacterium]
MVKSFSRNDTSLLARWWWTVDRLSLATILFIIVFGSILIFAASPAVAERIGLDSYHFVIRQFIFLIPSLFIMIFVSFFSPRQIQYAALLLFAVTFIGLILTLVIGVEIKGAKRWIGLGMLSLQPSEFAKPAFAILSAWLIANRLENPHFPGKIYSFGLFILIMALLLAQPDIGMAVVMTSIWFTQFFIAGLPFIWIAIIICFGVLGIGSAYFLFPHAASRIDKFLDPSNIGYQIEKSLEAFMRGGIFGRGPGEGRVKEYLPDAHADFVFAVAGEEFGLIACLIIIGLFTFVLYRGLKRLMHESNMFIVLAASGLLVQFALQAIINMASTLHLIPTKGMTLPFMSYGGSSLLALALNIGMLLALTRRRGDSGDSFINKTLNQIKTPTRAKSAASLHHD